VGGMRTHGRAAHAVDDLHCHFVFTANYHKPGLRGEIAVAVRDITRRVCHAVDPRLREARA
jgi:REP element-mobilizing transposase RayT